jgi:4-amino-4-deoxy-L-arabinose transferase-like glycosyltransferase
LIFYKLFRPRAVCACILPAVNRPTPAIVTQTAVRPLPRLALLLFCAAYVLPGFLGREPWRVDDVGSFGVMQELARGLTSWWQPQLLGAGPEENALLPYWLGALFIKLLPFLDPVLASRVPFALLLVLTLSSTWYSVYHLARLPAAQPLAFAFGGEASPRDYARALADAGLLALIACLGLAQLGHETTPDLVRLSLVALLLHAMARLAPKRHDRKLLSAVMGAVALAGLCLSAMGWQAIVLAGGWLLLLGRVPAPPSWESTNDTDRRPRRLGLALALAAITLLALWCGWINAPEPLNAWLEAVVTPPATSGVTPGTEALIAADDGQTPLPTRWVSFGRLLIWFTWPAWPLVLWTLWSWRRQLISPHVALPLWGAVVCLLGAVFAERDDRALLLILPSLAVLATFALPTLKRSVSSLIDWFTLLFFTGCAVVIWVIWLAMQTGVPAKPAANVARLAPGFVPEFSLLLFAVGALATVAWFWLVKWRVGRHRQAIWKSLVLPAAGSTLCWLLLTTLWLPLLDFGRSYGPLSRRIASLVPPQTCVLVDGLSQAQIAALQHHGKLELVRTGNPGSAACKAMVVSPEAQPTLDERVMLTHWAFRATVSRLSDRKESLLLYQRVSD